MRNFLSSLLEVIEFAIIAVGAVFLIRTFLVQPFLVNGSSMLPNFSDGDYLLVDELIYRFRNPLRGEVVVFKSPKDSSTYFIKRVIGLPGETVIVDNGKVIIKNKDYPEGFVLDERYLPPGFLTPGESRVTLGPDEYFVLGDNRSYSDDSRHWGAVSKEDIVGLVRLRLLPLYNAQAFSAPSY